ncbi:hypothetical protein [Streptomyces sp. XD-27]|uniref:hypothetical protein n=1 Tax=Streptomyces sp. XD-27 TaxID=3062779 RepID=UPI0026F4368E|nr:hypothetical protein [Streptomyces sp. XD-27]WKX70353.1 hypothetical protein Q3Y56_10855 [Streptomyces sp. XD-27]
MITPGVQATPGPGFVASVRLATGIHRTESYSVAQLLAYHVPPRLAHENVGRIKDNMRALADSLRLGHAEQRPPLIGRRIQLRGNLPWLDYGDEKWRLCIPAAPSWVELVTWGAPVRICVLLEPLAAGSGQAETDAHVRHCFTKRSLRWGTTYLA